MTKEHRVRISEDAFYKGQGLAAKEKMSTNDFMKELINEAMIMYENKKLKLGKKRK